MGRTVRVLRGGPSREVYIGNQDGGGFFGKAAVSPGEFRARCNIGSG